MGCEKFQPAYEHTQRGHWHLLLAVMAGGAMVAAAYSRGFAHAAPLMMILAGVAVFFAFCFRSLTVRDTGDCLALRFGPIPLMRKRIRYADITAVETGRSKFLDGWGMHYSPWRGWTYNIWGFDCVVLSLGERTVRVGSDDVERLAAFLRGKIGELAKV